MKRSFPDSFMAFLKTLCGANGGEAGSIKDRISSASHNRLKVIVKPRIKTGDSANNQPPPDSEPEQQTETENGGFNPMEENQDLAKFVPPETKRLANISQYRLAAYVAQLPEDEQKKALSTGDGAC